jgi:DNA helicase-2/ATP-dependent DNA helicase PcrA
LLLKNLGKYEIVEWLGGGRFGDVFLAFDTILEKNFALKITRMHKEDIVMLKDEAKLLSSLNHPHVVRFYNIDIIDNKFVLVMEYIKGSTLRDMIRHGGMDVNEAARMMLQMIDAIEYAHSMSVLHRDLKPENVLIADDGTIKITDFGLARFIKSGTLAASTAGTPIYMAPEAWFGEFTEKSDIWSLGVIFYELLTGVPPFMDDSLDGLRKKIEKNALLLPSILRSSIPADIEDTAVACLQFEPGARPDAAELLNMLSRKTKGSRADTAIIMPDKKKQVLELTPDQKEIIDSLDRKLLVLGQAGCGKTTTLTQGVIKLVERGLPVSKILICTFTNKAANDIKKRLSQSLPNTDYDMWIGTFHALASRILRRDSERLDIREDFVVEDPKNAFALTGIRTGRYKANAVLKFIGMLKAKGVAPDRFAAGNDWEKLCVSVYSEYQQFLVQNSIMDYDDLILNASRLLEENPDLQQFYQRLFEYIFIDELQDVNIAQYELIRRIITDRVFFTGDEDQAIYGWRGAEKELIYRVARDLKDVKIYNLSRSFRLPQAILDAANRLMHREATVIPNLESGEVVVYGASSVEDEVDHVTSEISELVAAEYQPRDIAVLFRLNHLSKPYEEGLAKAQIPHMLISGAAFRDAEETKPLYNYLEVLARSRNEEPMNDLIARGLAALKVPKRAMEKARKVIEFHLVNVRTIPAYNLVTEIRDLLKLQGEGIKELAEFARAFPETNIVQFVSELRLMQELDLANWSKDAVRLMTVHSAKGLEFPVVFVVDLVEDIFPITRAIPSQKEMEEERRLCYVAVTRAQKKLYLVYPKYRFGKQQLPSRFLIDMFRKK